MSVSVAHRDLVHPPTPARSWSGSRLPSSFELPALQDIEDRTITQDVIELPITIVRPAGLKEKGPVFMFIHGGGWVLGDFPTHERFVRDIVGLRLYRRFRELHAVARSEVSGRDQQTYAVPKWVAETATKSP